MRVYSSLALALLLAAVGHVHGSPMKFNPVTIIPDKIAMTHFHPAYGSDLTSDIFSTFVDKSKEAEAYMTVTSFISSSSTSTSTSQTANGTKTTTTTKTSSSSSSKTTKTTSTAGITFSNVTGSASSEQSVLGSVRRLEVSSTDVARLESFFGTSMELNADKLPSSAAAATMPWPSSYWPVYQDGINVQWDTTSNMSASQKYATAFDLDVDAFTKTVSESTGVLSQDSRTACTSDTVCTALGDSSVCAMRTGETSGYCIPTWFGICHAWSPAAILEPEPQCAVTKNGVTFQPFDIKALITQVYDGSSLTTVFTGVRFNGDDATEKSDKYGRPTDSARRDLGPGFFHVAMGNILPRFNRSFVIDVDGGAQVWNQPFYSYKILKTLNLSLKAAGKKVYGTTTYPFNSNATKIRYVQNEVTWIVESGENGPLVSTGKAAASYTTSKNYTYLLELDAKNEILGGEWIGASTWDHPDFLWFATERPADDTVSSVGINYSYVRDLLNSSIYDC